MPRPIGIAPYCGSSAAITRTGWPEYEWRWQGKTFHVAASPKGRGTDSLCTGKRFCFMRNKASATRSSSSVTRPWSNSTAARVVVECQKPLLRLLAGCPGIDQLIEAGEELPEFDVHAPLLSVPRICKTTLENIPAGVPYVFPEPALVMQWRDRLKSDAMVSRSGSAGRGTPRTRTTARRFDPAGRFAPLLTLPGVRFYSLQKGARRQLARNNCR